MKSYISVTPVIAPQILPTFDIYKTCVRLCHTAQTVCHRCKTQKLLQRDLFCRKMHNIQIQFFHATLLYHQSKAYSHPQITNIRSTLIYIFPDSVFPDLISQHNAVNILTQGFPIWGTCTYRGTFTYLKGYISFLQ